MPRLLDTVLLASTLVAASAVGLAAEMPETLAIDGVHLEAAMRAGAADLAARAEQQALSLCAAADPDAALGSDALITCIDTMLHEGRVRHDAAPPR